MAIYQEISRKPRFRTPGYRRISRSGEFVGVIEDVTYNVIEYPNGTGSIHAVTEDGTAGFPLNSNSSRRSVGKKTYVWMEK